MDGGSIDVKESNVFFVRGAEHPGDIGPALERHGVVPVMLLP